MKIIIFFGMILMYIVIGTISYLLSDGNWKATILASIVISIIMTCVLGIIIGMATLGGL